MSKFYEELIKATDETSQVQPIYRKEIIDKLSRTGNYDITKEIIVKKTDGILPAQYFKDGIANPFLIILECKVDQSFLDIVYRSEVILQVICYLKQEKEKGNELPRVAVIGSKKNCFVLPVSVLQSYISLEIKGYNKASDAYKLNTDIIKQIINDDEITKYCYIYSITTDFNMQVIVENLLKLAQDLPLTLEVEEKSISRVFDYFSMHVLKEREKGYKGEKVALDGRIQKDLFMTMLLKPNECYLHPKKVDVAVFGEGNLRAVNSGLYIAFKNSYKFSGYGKEDEKKFTEICDRLIEDSDRRNKGDFYTPTIWVDEAHKMLSENLGEDWKDEYIVWDCACGTKNLTRDYKFTELYSSTLEEGDLRIGERYNKGSKVFQYDFLNDDVTWFEELRIKKEQGYIIKEDDFKGSKLYLLAPELIKGLLSGKSLLFFINPPYGTAKNGGTDSVSKKGIAKNEINELMLKEKIGASSQQLYIQFLYRIAKIRELFRVKVDIGLFAPPAFLSGSSFNGFRKYMEDKLGVSTGFLLQGNQFADVSDSWGISFTLWEENKVLSNIEFKVLKSSEQGIELLGYKTIYNLDSEKSLSDWIKVRAKGEDAPQMSSAINYKSKGRGKLINGALGYMMFNANNIEQSKQFVTIASSCLAGANGVSIINENFEKCLSGFTARRLVSSMCDWVNWQDEYMIPNTEHELYKQWENDSIVYSLFNSKSNQSSLRDIDYNGNKWNIFNHFFFMSVEEMSKLASGNYNSEDLNRQIEDDIDEFGEERFIYKKLQEVELSPDAKAVLDKAKELVNLSFKNRELFNIQFPNYHINTWDAGWYQIKGLLKEYLPEDLKEFNKLYKDFEDRLRPLVYELGFLYK